MPSAYYVPQDYPTITSAVDNIPSNLVLDGAGIHEIIVSAGIYNENLSIRDFTTDSSNYIVLRAEENSKHGGVYDASNAVIISGDNSTARTIDIRKNDYCQVKDIQITKEASTIVGVFLVFQTSNVTVERVLVEAHDTFYGFQMFGTDCNYINCVSKGCVHGGFERQIGSGNTAYNCVSYDNEDGYVNVTCYNCVGVNNSQKDFEVTVDGDYNVSEDGTAKGSNATTGVSEASMNFVNAGIDFHVDGQSSLLEKGNRYISILSADVDETALSNYEDWPAGYHYFRTEYHVPQEYSTITSAINTIPIDLSGASIQEVVISAGTYLEDISISGFLNETSADYILIRAEDNSKHGGIKNTGVIVSGASITLDTVVNYTEFRDIQSESSNSSGASFNVNGATDVIFRRCFSVNSGVSSSGFSVLSGSATAILSVATGGKDGFASESGTLTCYNSVGYNHSGKDYSGSGVTSYNSAGLSNVTWDGSGDYNISVGSSVPGANSTSGVETSAMSFIDIGTDFHIKKGSVLISAGDEQSSIFITDVDGETIPTSAWPVGYDYPTAPSFENGTPLLSNYQVSGADDVVQTDFSTSAFVVVVAYNATAPTEDEILAGTGSGGTGEFFAGNVSLTESTSASITLSGLSDNLYDVYTVAKRENDFTTGISQLLLDIQIPSWSSGYPQIGDKQTSGFDILGKIDEDGVFYAVVVEEGESAPTSTEVKNGQASGGGSPLWSGNDSLTSGTEGTLTTSGLDNGTYDVYVLAEDLIPNSQNTPIKLTVTLSSGGLNVSGNYKGQSVNIIKINRNGSALYTVYIDGSGDMFVDNITNTSATSLLATSATVL